MIDKTKKKILIRAVVIFVILAVIVLALLFYYQQQGLIKIFPTAHDLQIKSAATIDESKFTPAQGLDQEIFNSKVTRLYELRKKILDNPNDSSNWDDFGSIKNFLNDHQGAVDAWEIAYSIQPLNFRTTNNLANVYQYFIKDYQKAEFYYLKTLELQPGLTIAYDGLIDLYQYNLPGGKEKLEPLLLEAIQKDSANAAAYYVDLIDFFALGDNDLNKAKEYFAKLKEINSTKANDLLQYYPNLK